MKKGKRRQAHIQTKHVIAQIAMLVVALILLAPILWMFSTSLKPNDQILTAAPNWMPHPISFEHFHKLFTQAEDFPVARWLFNSAFISTTVTLLALAFTSMAAYAFSRLHFKGRDVLFMAVIATMMIPSQITLIPSFLIVQKLGWFNSYQGLIVPGLAGAFGVFLLRQFFLGIPVELEEAAFMDGAGPAVIYWRVVLPLAKPALAALAIFTFIGAWNDFVWPLIITNDISMRTLPVGIMIFQGRYVTEYGATMATAAVCSVPTIIAFLIFQKRITEGIAMTGIKG
ncbi:MAG: carbohydrate ABC transporter permease [Armatimonadetes bacterium]|nr:carbohydrate ABC transporter permease [Armatimonadota bacterium]